MMHFFIVDIFAKPFKVATYNVENLFDDVHQGSEYDEYIPGKHNWNTRMVDIKLNHTAEVICDINADIIGLQEIENSHIFKALQKRLKRVGCAYKYSAISHKMGAPIQVALLSRYPIKKQNELIVSRSPLVRNILEVNLEVQGKKVRVFVNHWKSKGRRGVESKRIKYAKILKQRLNKIEHLEPYIVLGDLNSNYNEYLTIDKRTNDTNGKTAINDILQTKISDRLIDESQIIEKHKGLLYNTWNELPYKYRWSHKFFANKSTLDHILLPSSMFDGKGIEYVNNSFGVFKSANLFTKRGYINHWKYKNGKHMAKGYSDHLPIYALFDTKPYKKELVKNKNYERETVNIEYLYKKEKLESEILLKNVVVVLKRGNSAVVKQKSQGRGIFLYGCTKGMKEGRQYDLLVQEISTYKGLKEITSAIVSKKKGKVDLGPYYQDLSTMMQNEVVRDIVGVYHRGTLKIGNSNIEIHFKKKKLTPKEGAEIKIHFAHLGYYKKIQLVIYKKSDFEIME